MSAGGDRTAVEHLRALARQRALRYEQRRYLVDGPVLVADALRASVRLHDVYVEEGRHEALVDEAASAGVPVHTLPAGAIARFKATDLVTPQGIVAVAAMPDTDVDDAIETSTSSPVLVLCGLADPGNAGTILRMAEASGVGAVLFCDGSVDPFAPKCVRASAGSIFHLPVVSGGVAVQVLEAMSGRGVQRLGTDARRGKPYDEVDLTGVFALVLGNEAHGLSPEVADQLDAWIHVPMAGDVESLNVAMAASIICFDAARQRRSPR